MWRSCVYLSGMVLIVVALVAMPSVPIVESYAGGSAVRGYVEDGRYFVNPEHGRPTAQVSESTWRAVYWVERIWPWSAFVPGLAGLLLTSYAKEPSGKPTPVPPAEPPPWVLWTCLGFALGTVGGTWLCWVVTRTPWIVMAVGWVLMWASGGTCGWLYSRSLHHQSAAEPDTAPDRAGG